MNRRDNASIVIYVHNTTVLTTNNFIIFNNNEKISMRSISVKIQD